LYALLLFLGVNYAVANLAALVAGILFSFKMQGRFVFGNRDNRFLGRFVLCWAVIYFANITFIKRMMTLGMNGYVSGALTIPGAAVLSYLAQRFIVFRAADR
jgi:putative flippase GtrA